MFFLETVPKKLTIEEMYSLAKKRKGICLSKKYVNARTKLEWQCSDGHRWKATADNIKHGKWCPRCSGKGKTIEDMRILAEKRGGHCLSKEYLGDKTKLLWQCHKKHQWEAVPGQVSAGSWCPVCGGRQRKTIEEMQSIAAKHGGKCLSTVYKNQTANLRWQCAKGHRWEAIPGNVFRGSWCPKCRHGDAAKLNIKGNLQEMSALAGKRGGACLSKSYSGLTKKLLWRCKKGHEWEADPRHIKRGSWCPVCGQEKVAAAQRVDRIDEMREIAKRQRGECLSSEYINNRVKLRWRCSEGHEWDAQPSNIGSGKWCPKCGYAKGAEKQRKVAVSGLQQLAKERGGICLSKKYINSKANLKWRCSEGHEFDAPFDSVKAGGWCNACSSGRGERICREFFEQLFGKPFPKKRPSWLMGNKGSKLELDGYCEELKIAFEHQGPHHYRPHSYGGETISKRSVIKRYQGQKAHDELKLQQCAERSILLIQIPQLNGMLPIDELKGFIREKCESVGYKLPPGFTRKKVNLYDAYAVPSSKRELKTLQSLAKKHGGRCVSEVYRGARTAHTWECSKGHRWKAMPYNIKNGNWCRECAGLKKKTIYEMKAIAKKRGGECLSKEYKNHMIKLLWQCAKGHEWEAMPLNVARGSWCPMCGGNAKLSIQDMQKIAGDRGGKCLSKEYVNSKTKLQWQCAKGHEWNAVPSNVKGGTWCPYCAKVKKLTCD